MNRIVLSSKNNRYLISLLAVKEFALKETKQKKISILEKYDFLS
jgi:hypothetical protein